MGNSAQKSALQALGDLPFPNEFLLYQAKVSKLIREGEPVIMTLFRKVPQADDDKVSFVNDLISYVQEKELTLEQSEGVDMKRFASPESIDLLRRTLALLTQEALKNQEGGQGATTAH
eukprot:gnl/Trimastix_PCT/762.p1 GENE.gnl/Trimastix_PCT/762~~gnl/Trimastix_PCT/762.p1  ORF type:complete len:118 (-),score=16.43 gnl/Trimastix_PCT/762:86-439(-)